MTTTSPAMDVRRARPRRRSLRRLAVAAVSSALVFVGTAVPSSAEVTFDIEKVAMPVGQYQIAYSERNDVFWITTSCCQPPITESALLKVDAETLEIIESYTPPQAETGGFEAVYGIDVDDVNNTVWISATRQNGVAVYDQETGEHLAFLPDVQHSREVEVDETGGAVYVSSVYGNYVAKFDAETFERLDTIDIGGNAMGLDLDEEGRKLYTSTLDTNELVIFDLEGRSFTKHPIPTQRSSNVAVDPSRNEVYIASQGTANLVVADATTGEVKADIPTGDGSLTVDVLDNLVFVGNFFDASISVVDADTHETVATLPSDGQPNHIAVRGDSVYVVDKSGAAPGGGDYLTKITPVDDGDPEPPEPPQGEGISIYAEVPEDSDGPGGPDGQLTLTVTGDSVHLGSGDNAGDRLEFAGALPAVHVSDERSDEAAAGGAWSVSGQVGQFAGDAGEFAGSLLGWAPALLAEKDGIELGSVVGTGLDGGDGLSVASTLASATPEGRLGTTELGAELELAVPVDTPAGSYAATMTVSLFPTD